MSDRADSGEASDAVYNPNDELNIIVFPADVQQIVLVKEEEEEEWIPEVGQQDIKPLNIKEEEEEPWTSLEGKQLNVKEEPDATRFISTAVSSKSEKGEEKPLFTQLHQHQVEDGDPPTCSSADVTAATGGEEREGAETTRNLSQNTPEDNSNSPETDISEDYEDNENGNNSDSPMNHCSEFGQKSKDWKETRACKSRVNAVSCYGKQFLHNLSLQRHVAINSRIRYLSSLVNDKCVGVKNNADACKNNRIGLKSLSCDDCGKRFTLKANLNRHIRSHTGEKPFSCDVCGHRCSQKTHLDTHMRMHTGDKPFACDVCGQQFSHKTSLTTHMLVHTGQKPFVCSLCGQRFSHNTTLNTHTRIHTGQKPFACDVCGQSFSRKTNLNRHLRFHTGQKPFACDVCGQSFSDKTNLKSHVRFHTGEKPFHCEFCGQEFRQKSNLNTHMRVHTGEKPFGCGVCGQQFRHKTSLNRHVGVHTISCNQMESTQEGKQIHCE